MLAFFRDLFTPPRHLILLVLAAWVGVSLSEKRADRYHLEKNDLNSLVFYGLIAFLLGGRLAFALENMPSFAKAPFGIFSINPDLFDAYGGIAAACLSLLVFGQRRDLPIWSCLDALTPFLAILTAGMGLSHLAAGTAFGNPTNMPWGITLWNAVRHPTQIYGTLACLAIFAFLWFKRPARQSGLDFLWFACLFSAAQLFLAAFRADSTLVLNGYKEEQIMAWIVLAASFILIETRISRPGKR